MKILLLLSLLTTSTVAITLSGRVTPADPQWRTMGSHAYVQLLDGHTANVVATSRTNPFGYYRFEALPNHSYFIVAYTGKASGYGLEFSPTLYSAETLDGDLDIFHFSYTPFGTCLAACPL